MSMDFSALGKILLLSSECAGALSVCIGVHGCGWPSLMRVCGMDTAVFASMNRAPNSASNADDMTARIICEMLRMAPLLKGISSLPAMNMWPPAWLRAFWLGEVRCIAVDRKDHFARAVCEYCFFLRGHKIQKFLTQFHCFFLLGLPVGKQVS